MSQLSPHDVVMMFLSMGVLLASARLLGELAQRLSQPALVGEILAGVLLGPTVAGRIWPEFTATLFPVSGDRGAILDALTILSIALFLLVAGMEVQLSTIWKRGKSSLLMALAGFLFPFAVALVAAWLMPHWLGCDLDADPSIFALFFATAMSISAPPMIAKTLLDLDLYRSQLGRMILAAAVFNDLVGWMVFAVILALMRSVTSIDASGTILLTLLVAVGLLTVVRWLWHGILSWVQAHTSWPGGVIGLAMSVALLAAALTEWIGAHAIFGALLVGIAVGDSSHLREQTRRTISDFVSFIFAPLFFASVGLRVDFAAKFDPFIIVTILAIACLGKIVGCGIAGRLAGLPWSTSWATGFAMNARGAMEIILGLLALQSGLIRPRMFVALVIVALITSMVSEPVVQWLLGRRRMLRFIDYLSPRGFHRRLRADNRWDAMEILASSLVERQRPEALADSALWGADVRVEWAGPHQEVAVCLLGLDEITTPKVAVGIAGRRVDFGPLGELAPEIIVFALTPWREPEQELRLEADIVRSFSTDEAVERALAAQNLTEFLAAMRTSPQGPMPQEQVEAST